MFSGLSFLQYQKILIEILLNHKFGDRKSHYQIKYVDNCFDTRTQTIWSVTFRGFGNCYNFRTNLFTESNIEEKPEEWKNFSLFDLIMCFLNQEMKEEHIKKFIYADND